MKAKIQLNKKRKIWVPLLFFILILVMLIGVFYFFRQPSDSSSSKKNNRKSTEESTKHVRNSSSSYPFYNHFLRKTSKEITKVKKIDDNKYQWKEESEHNTYRKNKDTNNEEENEDGGAGSGWFTTNKRNISSLIQIWTKERGELDNWKESVWINWKQEIIDNLWLVKERHSEVADNGKNETIYYSYYENDNGEKVGEVYQEKEIIGPEKVKKLLAQEKKDRERRW